MMTTATDAAAMERDVAVRLRGVCKWFGDVQILHDIDLDIDRGETIVVIGPSGSGKTTMIRCINRLETIQKGTIEVDGERVGYRMGKNGPIPLQENKVAAQRQKIGMVFQRFNLFPHMTALNNIIEAPMQVRKVSKEDAVTLARKLLAKVDLSEKADSYPHELSGGQQQRVAIARMLAMQPDVLLFDEPTSALDPEMVDEVLAVIRNLTVQGLTSIVVTHEIAFARDVASRIVVMDKGKVIEIGTPDELFGAPKHPRTKDFLSRFQRQPTEAR